MEENEQVTMQDSIVENSCTYTEEVLSELYGKLMRKRLIIIFSIWLVFCVTYCLLVFQGGNSSIGDICMAIVTIVIVAQLIGMPRKQAKTACKKTKDLYNCYQEDKTVFYEDHIYAKNMQSNAELNLTYDKIQYIMETKNQYCIYLKVKSLMLLDKHNFTKGTQQEFLNLIQSKSIPMK